MTDINHVLVIGRLTKDFGADPRTFFYTTGGTACAKVSIAVNRSVKQSDGQWTDEVSFFDVTIWGKTAENLKPYIVKGKQIAVDGYLKQDRWQKDGQNFSKVVVVANSVQLLGGKSEGGQASGGAPRFQPKAASETQGQYGGAAASPADDGFPEDIPF